MYSGLQPAITALIATFSAVTETWRFWMKATCLSGSTPPASSIAWMRSFVAGTTGSPSVQPFLKHSSIASYGSATETGRDLSSMFMQSPWYARQFTQRRGGGPARSGYLSLPRNAL